MPKLSELGAGTFFEDDDILYYVDNSETDPNLKGKKITKANSSSPTQASKPHQTELLNTDGSLSNIHNTQSFTLVTFNKYQYCAYYNTTNNIVLGKRQIQDLTTGDLLEIPGPWTFNITTKTIANLDDQHDHMALGIDSDGFIHVSYGMHNDTLVYFKMPTAESIAGTPSANLQMLGTNETAVAYPTFFNDNNGVLYFMFRQGGAGNGDGFMYVYDVNTTTWARAEGTGPTGKWFDGKNSSPTVNAYWSRPWIDSNNVGHFQNMIFEIGGGPSTRSEPFWVSYDFTNGTFHKADGTEYTTPITRATADLIENITSGNNLTISLQTMSTYKDSNGDYHSIDLHNDANGIQQVFHHKYSGGSWTSTAITNRAATPLEVNSVPVLLVDPITKYFYVFTWNPSDTYSLQAIESRDLGTTWGRPFPINDPTYQRTGFNVDLELWNQFGVMYKLFEYTVDESANGDQTVYGHRNVYLNYWNPKKHTPKTFPANDSIIAEGDVVINSKRGLVQIGRSQGIDNSTLSARMYTGSGGGGGFEIVNVNNAGKWKFESAGATNEFGPILTVNPQGSVNRIFLMRTEIPAALDNSGAALFRWDVRRDNATNITGRIYFQLSNNGTSKMQMNTDDNLEIMEDGKGIILNSPNGTRYLLSVDNAGALVTTAL